MTADLLEGVRVLDMTNVLAGPFAGYQLARRAYIPGLGHRSSTPATRAGTHSSSSSRKPSTPGSSPVITSPRPRSWRSSCWSGGSAPSR
ncbi:hypothetical protein SHIRM173S_04490 [Streptomyces hirsutus]